MRISAEELRKFTPGVRIYKGKNTLFYNGEKLWEGVVFGGPLVYDWKERQSWEVIIVLPGVKIISERTFHTCKNVKLVIMADTVKRIGEGAFYWCRKLSFIQLSRGLESIGESAFYECVSLTSIYIPLSCRTICNEAFGGCRKLIILRVPQDTQLGEQVIVRTALIQASPLDYEHSNNEEINEWIKRIDNNDEYALHRACSSFNPSTDLIYEIVKRQEIVSFQKKDERGATPLQHLNENPFVDIDQRILMKRYILEMMGESI
ncbi:surface antigen BspA-like [Chaetoceros tenuissimus]|uniref:Surface antigen BspA-like n=1 Tax=Chaetoceros tenuissimus TaxID=426638 RepID=A0AAD3CK46_9STRA|nr:surface antigen BspA-like [Chaetoceros tenuissimus]